jgi:hypothetical protein
MTNGLLVLVVTKSAFKNNTTKISESIFAWMYLTISGIIIRRKFRESVLQGLAASTRVFECEYIQGVSEIRVLILTSERTLQFIKLVSITFCKIHKR